MKHIGHVSKAIPASAVLGYSLPRNIFDFTSWTDTVLVVGLTIEKFFDHLFGRYLIPRGVGLGL